MTDQTITIDGQPVPLDDVIWLERHPCGCVVSGVVAVVADEWTLTTADDAARHIHDTDGERQRAAGQGLTFAPVTGLRYRTEFADSWRCDRHARPASAQRDRWSRNPRRKAARTQEKPDAVSARR